MLVLNILLIVIAVSTTQSQYTVDFEEFEGEQCVAVQNGYNVAGTCIIVHLCPSILADVRNKIYDHTVCGYGWNPQIACCPNDQSGRAKNLTRIDLYRDTECKVAQSNEIGVMKFLSECPELNTADNVAEHMNRLCDYEICADLVCCPLPKQQTRLKNACFNVDHPYDTLNSRFLQPRECTIKELNMTGVYQRKCAYAERNPHLVPLLQNVCNDYLCDGWHCCPIEDTDSIHFIPFEIYSTSITVFVGPKCVDSRTGRDGVCKQRNDCATMFFGNEADALDKCGTDCFDTMYYCCPDDDDSLSISAKSCLSYRKYLSEDIVEDTVVFNDTKYACLPKSSTQVAGGFRSIAGDYPHMAALGYEIDQNIVWNCGGSLINDRYVLTAAHCISERAGRIKVVRLGIINLVNDKETDDCPEEYGVIRQITHPEYINSLSYNDIGLVELDGRVKFNFHIRPICLPQGPDVPSDFEAMGWGAIGEGDVKSIHLLKVYQTLFMHEECVELYQRFATRKIRRGIFNDTQICAGSRSDIQSTCQGDSGGPLVARSAAHWQFIIYGIVSYGTACGFANSPGIYTKVYPYVKWIETVVWGQ